MSIVEKDFINKLAGYFRQVNNITSVYDFAENPDNLPGAILPAVLFFPESFETTPDAHFNRWQNQFVIRAVLFVAPREQAGGRLKFLENKAIEIGPDVRAKFREEAVVRDLLTSGPGANTRAWLTGGQYGAGGALLTFNSIQYIGWVFTFNVDQHV